MSTARRGNTRDRGITDGTCCCQSRQEEPVRKLDDRETDVRVAHEAPAIAVVTLGVDLNVYNNEKAPTTVAARHRRHRRRRRRRRRSELLIMIERLSRYRTVLGR